MSCFERHELEHEHPSDICHGLMMLRATTDVFILCPILKWRHNVIYHKLSMPPTMPFFIYSFSKTEMAFHFKCVFSLGHHLWRFIYLYFSSYENVIPMTFARDLGRHLRRSIYLDCPILKCHPMSISIYLGRHLWQPIYLICPIIKWHSNGICHTLRTPPTTPSLIIVCPIIIWRPMSFTTDLRPHLRRSNYFYFAPYWNGVLYHLPKT